MHLGNSDRDDAADGECDVEGDDCEGTEDEDDLAEEDCDEVEVWLTYHLEK